ncbi:sensor domain-containing protein [Paenibacillus agricola]|uniref:EAL domain-containing protein n=1 Tax=Paenibacillus agricola TaxID=2716264 RepID=A0ABX0JJA6_9BACL|nr:bifunctional diguanylate cyclase/phosphodiesterase [Paenibacillus agricola]NHN35590.1 EAL domain-containing protein [Paenibacillus agricola]
MDFQHNEHFRYLVETSPDPVAIHCGHTLVYINKAGADLLGSDTESLIGKSLSEIIHPDSLEESRNHVNKMLREGKPSNTRNISLIGKDGQRIEVSIKSMLITYLGKQAIHVVYRDITEQLRAEKELKESNELVTSILESITDAFFAIDNSWNITYLNQTGQKYLGRTAKDLIGKNLWEEFPSLLETRFYPAYHKALTEKVVVEFEEFSPLTKRWYELRAFPTKDGLSIYYRNISERKAAEEKITYYAKELEISKSQLQQLVDTIDAGVWSVDLRTNEYMLSQGIETIYGYPVQAFYDNPTFWKDRTHPDDMDLIGIQEKDILSGRASVHEHRIIHSTGEVRTIRNRITPIFDQSNNLIQIVGVFVDITGHQRMEQNLRESQEWFSTTLKCIGDGVIATDITGKVTFMNPIAETLTACKEKDGLGKNIEEVLHLVNEETRQLVTNPVNKVIKEKRIVGLANHTVLINKDGAEIPIDDSAAPILNDQGEMAGIVMVFRDVIERKSYEEKIKHYAYYDSLTGLPNRRLFTDRLTMALVNAKRTNTTLATMFIDLDKFKMVNDTLGHEIGDLLLVEVASRLITCVREGDTVARLGGDEFIILMQDIDQTVVTQVAERIIKKVSCKYNINGFQLFTTPSIGTSLYPHDGEDVESLIKNADMAMYYVKDNGKNNHHFFASFMNDKTERKMEIDKGLREALEKNQFELYYQPKMDLVTGDISGVEALIRWHHPEMGMISPVEFIPVAEEIGLIASIGEWALQTACTQCMKWQNSGFPSIRVAVNVSTLQFRQQNLVSTVRRILKDSQLNPKCLELEITESVMQNTESIHKLFELKAMGIYMSIDDFGTGYSSLSYLKRMPIDSLKIDKSFINDIHMDPTDTMIVTTIINLAKSLNLRVIAEGVETAEQLQFLKQHKCDEIQGFFISKPVPAREFEMVWTK